MGPLRAGRGGARPWSCGAPGRLAVTPPPLQVLHLWEALWACPATPHLHLYACVAVLEHQARAGGACLRLAHARQGHLSHGKALPSAGDTHQRRDTRHPPRATRCAPHPSLPPFSVQRRRILSDPDLDFDGLLKLCVSLAGRIDLEAMLRDALLLCQFAGTAGAECCAALGSGSDV